MILSRRHLVFIVILGLVVASKGSAEVYQWIDESGVIHYGDTPPAERGAQPIAVPKGLSQEEIEQAQQQMRVKLDQNEESEEIKDGLAPQAKTPQQTKLHRIIPEEIRCHTPLSDLLPGPSGGTFTPITPTVLSKTQKKSLAKLFSRLDGSWEGTISYLACKGEVSDPRTLTTTGEARTKIDWNERKSRLNIDTVYTGDSKDENECRLIIETNYIGRSWPVDRLFHNFEIGNALYYTDKHPAAAIARKANEVEITTLSRNTVTFLTKGRKLAKTGGRLSNAQVRQLERRGRMLKLKKLSYHMGMLVGSSTWVLKR